MFETKYVNYFAFKGGTSLSKGWHLIDPFSEDIDISLSSEAVGMKYQQTPTKTYVEQLRRAGCAFTSNELQEALKSKFIESQVPESLYSIEAETVRADIPDTDPQSIYVNFISLYVPKPSYPQQPKDECLPQRDCRLLWYYQIVVLSHRSSHLCYNGNLNQWCSY